MLLEGTYEYTTIIFQKNMILDFFIIIIIKKGFWQFKFIKNYQKIILLNWLKKPFVFYSYSIFGLVLSDQHIIYKFKKIIEKKP